MIYPSADRLEERVESRYTLVMLAAKRAKQLREGAPKLIETTSTNPLTIALEEIAAGKITYRVPSHDEIPARGVEPELEALPEVEAAEEAAEVAAEVPAPTDEAARVAQLLEVPAAEEEAAEATSEEEPQEPELELASVQEAPAATEGIETAPEEAAAEQEELQQEEVQVDRTEESESEPEQAKQKRSRSRH